MKIMPSTRPSQKRRIRSSSPSQSETEKKVVFSPCRAAASRMPFKTSRKSRLAMEAVMAATPASQAASYSVGALLRFMTSAPIIAMN